MFLVNGGWKAGVEGIGVWVGGGMGPLFSSKKESLKTLLGTGWTIVLI